MLLPCMQRADAPSEATPGAATSSTKLATTAVSHNDLGKGGCTQRALHTCTPLYAYAAMFGSSTQLSLFSSSPFGLDCSLVGCFVGYNHWPTFYYLPSAQLSDLCSRLALDWLGQRVAVKVGKVGAEGR